MKKVIFSILVVSFLSSVSLYAGGGRNAKKNKTKKTCPIECCSKTKDCTKTTECPTVNSCVKR